MACARLQWPVEGTDAPSAAPCILASSFSSASSVASSSQPTDGGAWTAWAVLNACIQPVALTLSDSAQLAASHDITSYNMSDPGGWASLPAQPDVLPWRSGPLSPHVRCQGTPSINRPHACSSVYARVPSTRCSVQIDVLIARGAYIIYI